jgi:hypothetical protein
MSPRRFTSTAIVPGGVSQEEIDGADRGGELAPDEREAVTDHVDLFGEQPLEVGLDAVLLEAGVDSEVVHRVVQHFVDAHEQGIPRLGVRHAPVLRHSGREGLFVGGLDRERAGRAHPVEGLVGAAVGVDEERPVALVHEQPRREREMGVGRPV